MSRQTDILVIDDERVVLQAVGKVCSGAGLTVDEALSADAGLARLATNRYRLVLCDLILPGNSGIDVLRTVRWDWPDTPVVIITGFATWERTAECFAGGAFDVLPKPFDVAELLAVMQRGLGFSELGPSARESLGLESFADARPSSAAARALFALGQHAWASLDSNGAVRIGPGESFGPIDNELECVELPAVAEELLQGNRCARITTRSGLVHRVLAPLSGTIMEVNREWECGRVPAGMPSSRWLVGITPTDLENELPKLDRR